MRAVNAGVVTRAEPSSGGWRLEEEEARPAGCRQAVGVGMGRVE